MRLPLQGTSVHEHPQVVDNLSSTERRERLMNLSHAAWTFGLLQNPEDVSPGGMVEGVLEIGFECGSQRGGEPTVLPHNPRLLHPCSLRRMPQIR